MNDHELDRLVASTSSVSDERSAALPLDGPELDLMEAIMSSPRPATTNASPDSNHPQSGRPMRRRLLVPVAAALALLVGFAGFSLVDRGDSTAFAAEAIAVAEEAPRILIDAPGWSVTRADQFGATDGEMTFSKGNLDVYLFWGPPEAHAERIRDRASESEPALGELVVLDRTAVAFGSNRSFEVMWADGQHSMWIRSDYDRDFASFEQFVEVLDHLVEVDVARWLGAMPLTVVAPDARARAVDEMLRNVPIPAGFDVDALRSGDFVSDRYQLGAQVTGAVACRWIESWIDAAGRGDAVATDRAVDAMATSHSWRILHEMSVDGDFPDAIWEFAEAMADDSPIMGGERVSIRDAYGEFCTSSGL